MLYEVSKFKVFFPRCLGSCFYFFHTHQNTNWYLESWCSFVTWPFWFWHDLFLSAFCTHFLFVVEFTWVGAVSWHLASLPLGLELWMSLRIISWATKLKQCIWFTHLHHLVAEHYRRNNKDKIWCAHIIVSVIWCLG